uniref:Uncharacterized protein n=1 Tax=Romanomermis culicivorax TaxID=13658 RepID=A0A915HIM0_ROMCU
MLHRQIDFLTKSINNFVHFRNVHLLRQQLLISIFVLQWPPEILDNRLLHPHNGRLIHLDLGALSH